MRSASRIGITLVAVIALAAALSAAAALEGPPGPGFAIEVAEDGTRFVYDEEPVLDNGYPAYGNGFVTQGYIYPAGTLNGTDGVNPDGSPEFPGAVIGEWTCFGYFVGEGADTNEGAWVVTTQVFEFDTDVAGGETIVTIGSETPAGAGPAVRTVTGGTGSYAGIGGQVIQVTLGHNASEGVDATFEFVFDRAAPQPPAARPEHLRVPH